ncbi:MAG: molecular chaperone DnaJ [Bacteroidetes bacterium QH_1_61_8]|nr:MAG: molecular chaperone DnaJ [Bacteroidetes bacterium QH_1_61_8]
MTDRADASPPDYYARLGVRPSASTDEIRAAYREKARETHPDHNPDDPKAGERFQKVKEAYQVLRDSERRAQYDDTRTARERLPSGLTINQQAPAGCGGYIWRVLAGMMAFGLFLVLEVMDVWAASDLWTLVLAVGAASLVAGGVALLVAWQFPDEATDVMVRLGDSQAIMRADGHTTFQFDWADVHAVRLRDDGWTMELVVDHGAARALRPVPPVLTTVEHRSGQSLLQLDLSDTDVPRDVLLSFLRTTDAVPFPQSRAEANRTDHGG